jgi:hypothetical protein
LPVRSLIEFVAILAWIPFCTGPRIRLWSFKKAGFHDGNQSMKKIETASTARGPEKLVIGEAPQNGTRCSG